MRRWPGPARGRTARDPGFGGGTLCVGDGLLLGRWAAEEALERLPNPARSCVLTPDEQLGRRAADRDAIARRRHRGCPRQTPCARSSRPPAYDNLPDAVISSGTAARLGLVATSVDRYLIRLPHPVTGSDSATASDRAAAVADTVANWEVGPQHLGEAFRMLLLVASLVFALSVTGVAVALGEAEARPDQRTLLALGADPTVRRRITAARAGVLASIAGVCCGPCGPAAGVGTAAQQRRPSGGAAPGGAGRARDPAAGRDRRCRALLSRPIPDVVDLPPHEGRLDFSAVRRSARSGP